MNVYLKLVFCLENTAWLSNDTSAVCQESRIASEERDSKRPNESEIC